MSFLDRIRDVIASVKTDGASALMPGMPQITSAVRWLLGIGTGYLVGKGWLTADDAGQVALLAPGLAALIWGMWKSRQQGIVKAAAKIVSIPAPAQAKVGIVFPVKPTS